jgi:hypothetical protein
MLGAVPAPAQVDHPLRIDSALAPERLIQDWQPHLALIEQRTAAANLVLYQAVLPDEADLAH